MQKDAHKEYSSWSLIKDLFVFLKPYKGRFITATIFRALADIAWLYPAFGFALLVDFLTSYHTGESLYKVWVILAFYVLAIVLRGVFMYRAKVLALTTAQRVMLDAQKKSIAHMFELDISWHERENTGNRLKKIVRGADSIVRIFSFWINNLIEIVINFVGITIVMAQFDARVTMLTMVFLVTYYILATVLRRKAMTTIRAVNEKEEDVHGLLFESLNNIRSIKVLGMMKALKGMIQKETQLLHTALSRRIFWFQLGGSIRNSWADMFRVAVLVYIVYEISQGQYTLGFLVLFYQYFGSLVSSVRDLADITQEYLVARSAIGRMMDVLNEPITIDREDGKTLFPKNWKKISFKNVSFAYGENQVLHDISFDINRGERVGIVGLSGAGKSTLFKLMLKEHESYEGEILVDDTPLKEISKKDYFDHTAVVLQETEVFNFSLRDNITLANIQKQSDRVLFEKALTISHVENFLDKLPQGVDTLIGEKGIKLSGGERQRVGIARAVFKDPEILLMDEATSHLDVESEEKIRESLHEFFQSVTAIVIAHRLTTIKEMDRIIVVEGGKVIEEGSFAKLQRKKGRFHELWEKQNL